MSDTRRTSTAAKLRAALVCALVLAPAAILIIGICDSIAAASTPTLDSASPVVASGEGDAEAIDPEKAPVVPAEPSQTDVRPVDPYAGWDNWCAPLERPGCQSAADCPPDPHRPGATQKCVRPGWARAENLDYRVCVSAWPRRAERNWRVDRLGVFVAERCGRDCDRHSLLALLRLEAQKESSMRPWARHRLNPDREANRLGWHRHAARYGHRTEGGQVVFDAGGNVHYRERDRWSTGLGYFGANAALHTATWDPAAPPEVLCLEVPATETWLRRARRARAKIASGIDCDGDGEREFHGTACGADQCEPSWYDIHNAVAAGKLCPASRKRQDAFVRRAQGVELDPYGPVRAEDLGQPIPTDPDEQWAVAKQLSETMDAKTTAPW